MSAVHDSVIAITARRTAASLSDDLKEWAVIVSDVGSVELSAIARLKEGAMSKESSDKYGPWAVIAGASDGVGEQFAREVGKRGINVVLLARRQNRLDDVAAQIRAESGVETRAVAVDLVDRSATAAVAAATEDLDVGLFVYCAGADPDYKHFLTNSVEAAESMVQRNCVTPTLMTHHFAQGMARRGAGGIVLFGSAAGFVGSPNMAVYAASKSFDMIFAEALWAELKPHGVDVIGLILGETDTPALRQLRYERGLADGPDEPVTRAETPEQVVAAALEGLAKGPVVFAGKQIRRAGRIVYPIPRKVMVQIATRAADKTMGANATGAAAKRDLP
jgi:short-subunit dehydrogenase